MLTKCNFGIVYGFYKNLKKYLRKYKKYSHRGNSAPMVRCSGWMGASVVRQCTAAWMWAGKKGKWRMGTVAPTDFYQSRRSECAELHPGNMDGWFLSITPPSPPSPSPSLHLHEQPPRSGLPLRPVVMSSGSLQSCQRSLTPCRPCPGQPTDGWESVDVSVKEEGRDPGRDKPVCQRPGPTYQLVTAGC